MLRIRISSILCVGVVHLAAPSSGSQLCCYLRLKIRVHQHPAASHRHFVPTLNEVEIKSLSVQVIINLAATYIVLIHVQCTPQPRYISYTQQQISAPFQYSTQYIFTFFNFCMIFPSIFLLFPLFISSHPVTCISSPYIEIKSIQDLNVDF